MEDFPKVTFFTLNGTWLFLYQVDELVIDAGVKMAKNDAPRFTLVPTLSSKAEVDCLLKKAKQAGAII